MPITKLLTGAVWAILALLFIACEKSTTPAPSTGQIAGFVTNSLANEIAVYPAYIFKGEKLVAVTDEKGEFSLTALEAGRYDLICSALAYADTMVQVNVIGCKTTELLVAMRPDSTTGRVYVEFQDNSLFREELKTNPTMANWDAHQVFDGVTGATLQSKTLRRELPYRYVFLGDSLLAVSDDFGQAWCEIQCGTYPLRGACEGYADTTAVIKILPDARVYLTFFMREVTPGQ